MTGKKAGGFLKTLYKKIIYAALFGLFASFCSSCGGGPDSRIIVAGSTSVQPYAEILAEEFAHLYPEYEIDVQGGGSSAGIAAVVSGTADVGMSSRDLTDSEAGLWTAMIAKDGLAVIVHPDNPVAGLTLGEIRGIYDATVTNWNEVGGHNAKIHVITREEGSGTRSAFESLVMGDRMITPKAIVQDSNGAVRQLVLSDKNSIGFISLGLVDGAVKALSLDGVTPTAENVENGSYSLYRPFLFVLAAEPEGMARLYVEFCFSDEAQALIADEGLIPYSFFMEE